MSKVRISNIKSIESVELPLASLNVLLGTNSAGKSTILQSLAMLAQNGTNYGRKDLALNGNLVKLGSFLEFKRRGSKNDPEIEIEITGGRQELHWFFEGKGKLQVTDQESEVPALISARFTLGELRQNRAVSRIKSINLNIRIDDFNESFSWNDHKINDESNLDFRVVQISEDEFGLFEANKSPVDLYPSSFLRKQNYKQWLIANLQDARFRDGGSSPHTKERDPKLFENRLRRTIETHAVLLAGLAGGSDKVIQTEGLIRFGREISVLESSRSTSVQGLKVPLTDRKLGELLDSLLSNSSSLKSDFLLPVTRSDERSENRLFVMAATKVSDALKAKLQYLGPLRLEPTAQQHYEMEPPPSAPVGPKGEYFGYQLAYARGSTTPKTYPGPNSKTSSKKLGECVMEWMQWFNLGKSIQVRDEGRKGLETRTDNEALYQKGTGLSQILPVLVLCLVAEPGSLTLIEQPELHLHPAVQQRLGDFLLEIAKSGRHVLIETHSEYLVTRLRKLVYVDGEDSSKITLAFATKDDSKRSSSTKLQVSKISDLGGITSWPEGFFDFANMDESEILAKRFSSEELA
jgi:predicted ATPase